MKKSIIYFSAFGLIICFLISTLGQFPPNIHPVFINIVRSETFIFLVWLAPIFSLIFLFILCFLSLRIPYAIIAFIVCIFAGNMVITLWEDKVIMSWLWKKDLATVVELAKEKKLKNLGSYNDGSNIAMLSKDLRYLTNWPGRIAINLYKTHANEMTLSIVNSSSFLSSYSFFYSSVDLPPTTKNKRRMFENHTSVGTVKKIMPNWYLISEWYEALCDRATTDGC